MFFLFVTVSLINLALGYALAVHMGWGKWPNLRDEAVAKPHGSEDATAHADTADHGAAKSHAHH